MPYVYIFTGSNSIEDGTYEGNETVTLTIQNVVGGAWLGLGHTATLTILDNDP